MPINQAIDLVHNDQVLSTFNNAGFTTLFFASKTNHTYYKLFAYIDGKWTNLYSNANEVIYNGQFKHGRYIIVIDDSSRVYLKNLQPAYNKTTMIPIGNKYSLSITEGGSTTSDSSTDPIIESALLSVPISSAQKTLVREGLRRVSWYGPQFNMQELSSLDYLIDLNPYGICLAKYKKDNLSSNYLDHNNSPYLVFSKKTSDL